MSLLYDVPLDSVKGIGPKLTERLNQLGLFNLQDILFFLPYKYQDRSHLTPISQLNVGSESLTQGSILDTQMLFTRQRMLICHIAAEDGSQLMVKFFHFNKQQQSNLAQGQIMRCFGEVRQGRTGLEMIHPEYRLLKDELQAIEDTYTPVYHQIQGVSQIVIQKLVSQALYKLNNHSLQELLPEHILAQYNYPLLSDALKQLHQPSLEISFIDLMEKNTSSHQRLAFEELLAHQLSVCYQGKQMLAIKAPFKLSKTGSYLASQFIESLPFQLTKAQKKVIKEIQADLNKNTPMSRLLQGDVGSGKTVVAAITILYTMSSGFQAVLMAPTELLAEQLFTNLSTWFKPLSINISYLSGKIKGKLRQQVLEDITSGQTQLVIGTHAVFQSEVKFHQLALVIIDEQHRFGVHQRMSLRNKGIDCVSKKVIKPHLLVMTATPIPRTLAMTAYADLSCSIIDELPPGRKPVKTIIVPQSRREEVIDRIYHACMDGKQCYWVCTLIEESEVLQCQAAEKTYQDLITQLTGIRIGLIHGRMNNEQKSTVMAEFKNAQIQLLISTTVVEVGVDVPNASLMIIENAERLGLSQLHQLRGRVGRGVEESICALIYGQAISQQGKKRLKVIRETNNGFEIAEQDLKIRGPGEFLGTRQTGLAQMKIADLIKDQVLIPQASQAAKWLIKNNNPAIEGLIKRWIGHKINFKDA
jgi:ATP-dependent DNA helicase RecG